MKVCIHSNQFDGRGTGKTPRDYGLALRDILGHEVCYLTSSQGSNAGVDSISQNFPVHYYPGYIDNTPPEELRHGLELFVAENKIDFMHMLKFGVNDGVTPRNCMTGVHYVFNGSQPHGTKYAAVSENLARKFGRTDYVPHIVVRKDPSVDLRPSLGIPRDALVVGRHGGYDTFDLPFVHEAVAKVLESRNDVYFVFLSTAPFIQHERAIFIDWIQDEQGVYDFIHSCDIMLHGRQMGETFGLAVAEFSSCNKPVMTWTGPGDHTYDTAHIDHLMGNAILYRDRDDLISILLSLNKRTLLQKDWDTVTSVFSPSKVITKYSSIFLWITHPHYTDTQITGFTGSVT